MKKTIVLIAVAFGFTANAQSQSWNLTGNAGTNPTNNFIGTTDNQPLNFKINNSELMRISTTGRFIFYGIDYPGQIWNKSLLFGGGVNNPSGTVNTVVGIGAFTQNTGGSNNVALGGNAMSLMTSGDLNVAIGVNSMRNTESGNYNTGVGMNALEYFKSGSGNVGIGHAAMGSGSLVGNDNVALGTSAGRYISSGTLNVILGANSFRALSTGSSNISVGSSNARDILSGNNNIFIGTNITPYTTSPENELNIGNWIVGNNGTIGIGQFINQLPANGIAADGEKYKLFVKDGIKTEKVKVDIAASNGWADYVFEKDYKLMPLKELATFIENEGHLPEVPTTEEAVKNGIELKEMNILLLKKVEELTLHLIRQDQELKSQKEEIQDLQKQISLSK